MLKNLGMMVKNTMVCADTKRLEAQIKIQSNVPTNLDEVIDMGFNAGYNVGIKSRKIFKRK